MNSILNYNLDYKTCQNLIKQFNSSSSPSPLSPSPSLSSSSSSSSSSLSSSSSIIIYRIFKNIIENIIKLNEHNEIHNWILLLKDFQINKIQWNEDKFYTLLLLISSLSYKWCEICLEITIQFLKNKIIQDIIEKYLPRILSKQPKNIGVFEWKVFQNLTIFLPIPRLIQRNLLTLIRETYIWNTHYFTKQNIDQVTPSTIFIIESTLNILFTIKKVIFQKKY